MGRDPTPRRLVVIGLFALAAAGLSCRSSATISAPGPRPKLLGEGELEIAMSRVGEYPRRVFTSSPSVPIRVYMDPGLADVRRVREYVVWRRASGSRDWQKIGTMSPYGDPLRFEPGEGMHGLRASIVQDDGSELLMPGPADDPALWLCVDRSPPAIAWVSPDANTSIRGKGSIQLVWSQDEAQFGNDPTRLEWSADGGSTWKPVGTVPAAPGRSSFTWKIPPGLSSDVQVRVTSRDLSGHEATSAALVLIHPAFSTDGPAVAAVPPEPARGTFPAPAAEPSRPAESSAPQASPPQSPRPDPSRVSPAVAVEGADRIESTPRRRAGAPAWVETPAPASSSPAPAPPPEGQGENALLHPRDAATAAAETSVETVAPEEDPAPIRLPPDVAALQALERKVFRSGETLPVAWTWMGPPIDARAELLWKRRSDADWMKAAEAHVAVGRAEIVAPRESGPCSIRLRIVLAGGAETLARGELAFTVDGDPPMTRIARAPETAGSRAAIEVGITDEGGAGPALLRVLGKQGASPWSPIPGGERKLDGRQGTLTIDLDLSAAADGPLDLWAVAEDSVGNRSEPPEASGAAGAAPARIRIDRAPPSLAAQAPPIAWVSGFRAEARVIVDWTDAVPPLVVEGRIPDAEWAEVGRWSTIAPGQDRFGFEVPAAASRYAVRFTVTDAAGNRARAEIDPRAVESPVRLASFTETGRTFPARGAEKIRWTLHPAAAEIAQELRARIEHQAGSAGKWLLLYDNLPALAECYWELPDGDLDEHRLRVRLIRGTKLLGEDISPAFSIGGANDDAPTVVKIDPESIFYSNQARSQVDRYFAALGGGGAAGTEEIDRLGNEIIAGYERALNMDPSNYHATYGLAQFLNRADPDRNAKAVLHWLARTLETKPDHFWALNDLGALHIRNGEYAKAEEVLRKCQAMEPSEIVLYNLGLSLFYGGKPAEARKRFEEALHADGAPHVPEGEIYYYLCHSYLEEGNADRARGIFREKEKLIPADLRADLAKRL